MKSGLTFTSITQQLDQTWIFKWTATNATKYRIVLYGSELATITDTTYVPKIQGYSSFPPPIEVMENDDLALSEQFPPYLIIQWYGEPCDYYIVEELVGTTWNVKKTINEIGSSVYSITTPILVDGSNHIYGIQAVSNGLVSSVQRFMINVIASPIIDPAIEIGYDPVVQNITITGS